VTTVLKPQLVAAGVTPRRLKWVAIKVSEAKANEEAEAAGTKTGESDGATEKVRCAFSDRILHSRTSLDSTHACLK
jgi:hypothetical protein